MSLDAAPRLIKWPFWLVDITLLGTAAYLVATAITPLNRWEIAGVVALVVAAGIICIIPYLREHKAAVALYEKALNAATLDPLRDLEQLSTHIRTATSQWQGIQETARGTIHSAGDIATRMQNETKAFTEFMSRADDGQKQTMRFEIDKLRRGEQELLQVIVTQLDHTHALFLGAQRSGQEKLIQQIGQFRAACLDNARRIGLVAHEAGQGEAFNPEIHQAPTEEQPQPGTRILETMACGYSYQGQGVRRILVAVEGMMPDMEPGMPS